MKKAYLLTHTCTRAAFSLLVFLFTFCSSYVFCHESVYIDKIKVKGCQSVDDDVVQQLIGIEEGTLLDREALRKGVIRAFRKDIFDDIMVTQEMVSNGTIITIHVQERPFIEKIEFKGNKHISTDALEKIFIFQEGQR